MFPVCSNYMVWKRLRAHFCLDNGLELAWSEATLFWDGLIRVHFGLELAWSEAASSALRAHNDLRAHSRRIRGHFGLGRSDQRSHLSGTVWSEVPLVWDGLIRGPTCLGRSDQRSHLSGTIWSEVPLVWDGLIRGPTCLGRSDQRSHLSGTVWSEVPLVWDGLIRGPTCLGRSDQRSHLSGTVWSEVPLVWDGLIRGPTCLGRSDQRRFGARPQPGYCQPLFKLMAKWGCAKNDGIEYH